MLKRVLLLINNEQETKNIIKFSQAFKEKYNVVLDAIYVKDMIKYEIFPSTIEGIGVNLGVNYALEEIRHAESKNFQKYKEQLELYFDDIYEVEGETVETVLDHLKIYDLLVVTKLDKIMPYLRELLRTHYKPIMIISDQEEYKFDNVILLDDGGYKANKSLFSYFTIFGERKINVLRVNIEEEDLLKERFKDNYILIDKIGDPLKVILEESEKHDMIVMGDLKYAVMIEKIAGKVGIKILETVKKPIFIG